jgi:hypothetical protein
MSLDVESDLQCALMDVGVLYASGLTHAGWDALNSDVALDPPTTPEEIPVIECRKGDDDGGHAFAIVGYTKLHRAQLLGPEVGPRRLCHPDVQRLAAERDGLLGYAARRRHARAPGCRTGELATPRR